MTGVNVKIDWAESTPAIHATGRGLRPSSAMRILPAGLPVLTLAFCWGSNFFVHQTLSNRCLRHGQMNLVNAHSIPSTIQQRKTMCLLRAVSYGVWTSGRFATEGRFEVARLVWYSEGSCMLRFRNQWHIVIQCKINWELWTKVLTGKMPLISPLIQQAHNITGFSVLIINTYWSSCQ